MSKMGEIEHAVSPYGYEDIEDETSDQIPEGMCKVTFHEFPPIMLSFLGDDPCEGRWRVHVSVTIGNGTLYKMFRDVKPVGDDLDDVIETYFNELHAVVSRYRDTLDALDTTLEDALEDDDE